MLRKIGLLDRQPFLDRTGGKLAISQNFDDGDPGGVRQSLKNVGFIDAQRVLHYFIIFDTSNMRK